MYTENGTLNGPTDGAPARRLRAYRAIRDAIVRTELHAGGYRPLGFVWNAWAKAYKLGVQASSDHVSTHTPYACVIAENSSRFTWFLSIGNQQQCAHNGRHRHETHGKTR